MYATLIGSKAAFFNDISLIRESQRNEWDFIMTKDFFDKFLLCFGDNVISCKKKDGYDYFRIEVESENGNIRIEVDAIENKSNTAILNDANEFERMNFLGHAIPIASPSLLYDLKRSHANYDIHFEKTISDLYVLEEYRNTNSRILPLRKAEIEERKGTEKKKINLNKTNEAFFKGGQKLRKYDHDALHKVVAMFPDFPMFTRCKWDMNSAKIERDLFERLHPDMKAAMAMEEAMVIAIERYYLHGVEGTDEELYRMGLKKLIKDMTKGWFQDFMLDNLREIWKPKWNFINRFEVWKPNAK